MTMSFKKMTKRYLTSEMDRNVKRMMKLIEEDGDSFAKKAEMYYQKRPQLVALVEEFYRGYRTLAERYDHVTGELSKNNAPSDLQSQATAVSDIVSEASPSPRKVGRRMSGNRAAGFDFFLGSGGNGSDVCLKDGDESSTLTDSDGESDYSLVNNCSGFLGNGGGDPGMNRRIMELETVLREVKEKPWMQEEEHAEGSCRGARNENNTEDFRARVNAYEQELRNVNEKLRLSEEETSKLKVELERYRSMESANLQAGTGLSSTGEDIKRGGEALVRLEHQGSGDGIDKEFLKTDDEIKSLGEELGITREKLESSELQIASLKFEASKSSQSIQKLKDQLNMARKDIAAWKARFNSEKRESTRLQERLARLKTSPSDRDHEIRVLKTAVSDAEQNIFAERARLKSQMSKLLEERTLLEEHIREWECRGSSLEEEIRKIHSEKIDMEETLKGKTELLKADIKVKENNIKDLNASLDALRSERDDLNAEVGSLKEEVHSRDNQIDNLNKHLKQLQMEHVQLIAGMEEAQGQVEELKSRAKQLEEKVERQRTEILEGAEEKREAIRQLCFSLEHYRIGYDMLRQAFIGHKRVPILAA